MMVKIESTVVDDQKGIIHMTPLRVFYSGDDDILTIYSSENRVEFIMNASDIANIIGIERSTDESKGHNQSASLSDQ